MKEITLTINGHQLSAAVEPRISLGDFLRVQQNLTGTHFGCEHGVCGACTVLINGVPARSCIAFAVALDGADVRTIEGFEDDPLMAAVRDAFHRDHAVQCGYCTPAMLITARDIVTRFAEADEKRIRSELSGNLCRCTGYMGIVNAVQRVMRELPAETRLSNATAVRMDKVTRPGAFQPFITKEEARTYASVPRGEEATEELKKQGWHRLTDSFLVERPLAEVWNLLANLPRLAACMPGAHIIESDGRNIKGEMRVAFGPIRARFTGTATVQRDDAHFRGILEGGGSDAKSGSRAKGQVIYRLAESKDGKNTRVEVTLDYQLQGALAQFSRPSLIKDFLNRLISEFANNLADELAGRKRSSRGSSELRATGLIWSVLWLRIKRWFGTSS
jgi:carbon-monoxide dehydrogenase small subunit